MTVSILPDEELVLEGYSPQLSGDLLLGTEARPNLDLDIRMENARISDDVAPLFRHAVKAEPPRKLAQMRYFARSTTALDEPACLTGFSLHHDRKARADSLDVRVWLPRLPDADDFRSLALRSSAALVLDVETVLEGDGASDGPGCSRVVGIRGTRFSFAAPLAFRFDVPADQMILLTFERLSGEPQPWQGNETPFRPLAIAAGSPLTVRTVLVRKPSSKPGEEALAARGEPGSIRIVDLTLAAGRLQATLAGEAKIQGSRAAPPGWLERRPDSASGWLAILVVLGGHCAFLWLALHPAKPWREVPMEKVFISYNRADRQWAEWIAWTLEEAGHSAVLDTWDFRPGENFILEMHKAAVETERTIVVLSDNYLKSEYTQPEWAAAFAEDPRGEKRKLIPLRVAPCQPQGLLRAVIYVDLVGLGEEDARFAVLGAFSEQRPKQMPPFPGRTGAATQSAPFPGSASASVLAPALLEGRPERRGPSLAPDERFALVGKLNALPPQQFNMILFALSPPPGLIPPMPAPQGDRVVALLGWAESPGGCGLEEVQRLLATVLSS